MRALKGPELVQMWEMKDLKKLARMAWIKRIAGLAVLVALSGCTVNPATGERQLTLIGEQQEIAMGIEADKQVGQSMGLYPDEDLQRYVNEIGQRLAARSERPDLPWSFRVVDDSAVNAFALPGGFIYLTRGIMAHFNSEAEMAAVLGHEIGHVTGRHSVEQMSRQQLAGIGLMAGMVLSEDFRQYGQAAQAGLGLLFLKYGRDDERQADDLGLRYLVREDYDPREMPEVFDMLSRVSQAAGPGRAPPWMSTHPAPEERAQRSRAAIEQALAQTKERKVLSAEYLARLDGMTFGSDPRQGYFSGDRFYHPELAFQIDFPSGWQKVNQPSSVIGVSPNQDAMVGLSLVGAKSAEEAVKGFFSQEGVRGERPRRGAVHGLTAVSARFAAAQQQAAEIAGTVTFVEYDKRVYQLLGYTSVQKWPDYESSLALVADSFQRVTDRRVLSVEAGRLDIVKIPRALTMRQFVELYRGSVELEQLALINRFEPDEEMPAGTLVKRVVGGDLPN